jgi:hypothetical protein
MQYKGPKSKNMWKKRAPQPIRLAFGLIEPVSQTKENNQTHLIQEVQAFEKQKNCGFTHFKEN